LTPFNFRGGCNFLISNPFLMIVSVSDDQEGRFQFCLDTRNNRALPLDPACPEHLSVWSSAGLPYVHGKNAKKQDFWRFIPDQENSTAATYSFTARTCTTTIITPEPCPLNLSFGISYPDFKKIPALCRYHWKRCLGVKGGSKTRWRLGDFQDIFWISH